MNTVVIALMTAWVHEAHGLSAHWRLYLVVGHVGLVLFNYHAVIWVTLEYFYQYNLGLICLWEIGIKTFEINFHIVNFVNEL